VRAYLTDKLEQEIVNGGIIIAPKGSGKTIAIINILCNSENYMVVCSNREAINRIIYEIQKRSGKPLSTIKRIVVPPVLREIDYRKRIIVDDFLYNPLFNEIRHSIHCAISDPYDHFTLYDSNGVRFTLKRDDRLQHL
jgi:hypothetical protein